MFRIEQTFFLLEIRLEHSNHTISLSYIYRQVTAKENVTSFNLVGICLTVAMNGRILLNNNKAK